MGPLRPRPGDGDMMRWLIRTVGQLGTDVKRLLRRQPDLAGSELPDMTPGTQSGGGQQRIVEAEIHPSDTLASGSTAIAIVTHGPANLVDQEITVRGDFIGAGCSLAASSPIIAIEIEPGRWQAILTDECDNITCS